MKSTIPSEAILLITFTSAIFLQLAVQVISLFEGFRR